MLILILCIFLLCIFLLCFLLGILYGMVKDNTARFLFHLITPFVLVYVGLLVFPSLGGDGMGGFEMVVLIPCIPIGLVVSFAGWFAADSIRADLAESGSLRTTFQNFVNRFIERK